MWLIIPVSAFFFWTHTSIPKKYIYTVSIDGERPRERRLPWARYYLSSEYAYISRVCNIARNLSELPHRIHLTHYARATVNRETKFHPVTEARYSSEPESYHTWNACGGNGRTVSPLCMISGRNLGKNFQGDALYENCILSANIFK